MLGRQVKSNDSVSRCREFLAHLHRLNAPRLPEPDRGPGVKCIVAYREHDNCPLQCNINDLKGTLQLLSCGIALPPLSFTQLMFS